MNKNLCVMPWFHTATLNNGDIQLCCLALNNSKLNLNNISLTDAWNSEYYKKTRIDMLSGHRVAACEACWKEEDAGVKSHRMISNSIFSQKAGAHKIEELINETLPDGTYNTLPPTIDFRLGNVCNLQCVMCQPSDSSKWVVPSKKLSKVLESPIKFDWQYKSNLDINQFDWAKQQSFWEDFYKIAPNIRHITFGGGEPLLVKEQKLLVKKLVDDNLAKNIELLYHTNCTIYDQELLDYWSNFKSVKLMLSIDGTDSVNSYIRRPANWAEIEQNLKLYDKTPDNIIVSINCTIQLANILNCVDFGKWLLDQKFKKVGVSTDGGIFFASLLHWPRYLSIQVLPAHIKETATAELLNFVNQYPDNVGISRLKNIVNFMNLEDKSSLYPQALEFFDKNDQISPCRHSLDCTGLV